MAGKRRHKRVIKRLHTEFSSEDSSFRGTTSNLSESGLFLKTIKPLSVDTQVEVGIQLSDNTVSKLKGTVRWNLKSSQRGAASRSGMGIEIIENDRYYVDFLNALLPPEEQILYRENRKTVLAPPAAKVEHIAPQKSRPVPRPKSPPAVTRQTNHKTKGTRNSDLEAKDNEIDSLISSLFSKGEKKQGNEE